MWESLKAHHQRLAEEDWQAPAQRPEVFNEPKQQLTGYRKLTEVQVGEVRHRARTESVSSLAKEYGVTRLAMTRIVKGYAYRYLNRLFPPQR